jgi:transposase
VQALGGLTRRSTDAIQVVFKRIRACLTKLRGRFGCDEGMHDRHDLSDQHWAVLEPLLPVERTGRRGRPWIPHRQVVNGVLWRTRTGAPWRDLPSGYGVWQTVYGRHRTWSADGTWERLLRELMRGSDADDEEWTVSVDSTSIRADHHAAGARKSPPLDVTAERLAVAFADGQREVVAPAEDGTGGSIELQGSAA